MTEAISFYLIQFIILASALAVVLVPNPIYSAISLAVSMTGIAALFFSLEAYFIAGVQLVVYAGAVMVLFVMVVMLFDLKKEKRAFSRGTLSRVLKTTLSVLIFSMIAGALSMSFSELGSGDSIAKEDITRSIKELSALLYTKYVFAFEALAILLVMVIVGAIALAKAKGGTHAK
tara:strand:+ start:30372 stop:30896 length:525 start_codon:yes stop_codon:yes gene_type:complete